MAFRSAFFAWFGLVAVAASGLFTGCGDGGATVTAQNSKFKVAGDGTKPEEAAVGLPPAEPPQGAPNELNPLGGNAVAKREPGTQPETATKQPSPATAERPAPAGASGELTVTAEVKQMVVMIRELSESQPPGKTEEEQVQNLLRAQYTIVELASRLLQSKSPLPVYTFALENASKSLQLLGQIGDPSSRVRAANFAAVVAKHPNADIARQGRLLLFDSSMATQLDTDKVDAPAIIKEVEQLLSTDSGDQQVLMLTSAVCQMLGDRGQRAEAAKGMRMIATAYKDNKDPQLAELGKMQESSANLLDVDVPTLLKDVKEKKPEAEARLLAAFKGLLKDKSPSLAYIQPIMDVINRYEMSGDNALSQQFYDLLETSYTAHENPQIGKLVSDFVAMGRKRFALVGQPFEAKAVTLDGRELDLKPYQGKVVLVNFWGTFVGPALRELPIIHTVFEELKDQGFDVISLMLDTDTKQVEGIFKYQQKVVPWPSYLAPEVVKGEKLDDWHESSLAKQFGLMTVPFYVLVGKDGKIDSIHYYPLNQERVGGRLKELLNLKEAPTFAVKPLVIENPTLPKAAPIPTEAPPPADAPVEKPATEPAPPAKKQGRIMPRWSPDQLDRQLAALLSPASLFAVIAAEDAPAEANPYLAKPDLNATQLTDWVLRMLDKPKTIQTRAGFSAAIVDACDRVLANKEAKETEQLVAIENKLAVLHRAACSGDDACDKQLTAFVAQLKDDARPRVARETSFFQQERKVLDASEAKPEELATLLKDLQAYFTKEKLASKHLRMASATVDLINKLPDGDAREKHFAEFGQVFAKSSDKELARYGKKLAKKPETKESDLVGKPLELAGNTAAGMAFAWEKYRGKVVIVDFWATWCGPCRKEMPNVKALRDKLKDKGFEIVGVSVDKDLEALDQYIDENDIPWETLAGDEASALAEKYGVRGIPTMMLIDQKGNVVAVAHNVAALTPQAEKLLEAGKK